MLSWLAVVSSRIDRDAERVLADPAISTNPFRGTAVEAVLSVGERITKASSLAGNGCTNQLLYRGRGPVDEVDEHDT